MGKRTITAQEISLTHGLRSICRAKDKELRNLREVVDWLRRSCLAIQVRTPQGIHDVLNREINRLYQPILRLTIRFR
jgi:hypothetical protein